MGKYTAGSISSNGVDVPVFVDDQGNWTANYAGKFLCHDTRDKLANALERLTKVTKGTVEVPIVRYCAYDGYAGDQSGTVTRGVLTGIHSGTGNVLAAWDVRGRVEKEQITRDFDRMYVAGDTTDEELAVYDGIRRELRRLGRERAAWENKHQVNPKNVVEQALAARAGEDD